VSPPIRRHGTEVRVRVPDSIVPINAFRVWWADPISRLHSLNAETVWRPLQWTTARCTKNAHEAPTEGCTCGLYASKELDELLPLAASMVPVHGERHPRFILGRVELAGKVVEHTNGYRAERARVAEIIPVSGLPTPAERVACRYGVPLGAEIRAPAIPHYAMRGIIGSVPAVRAFPPPRKPRLSVILSSLWAVLVWSTVCLFFAVTALRGVLWDHRLTLSDWWLCGIVVISLMGLVRVKAFLLDAIRGLRMLTRRDKAKDSEP
jgi:hypothetical protein